VAEDFLPFIESTARQAGALLMSHFGKVDVEYKGQGKSDVVTIADRESEKLVVGLIRARYPQHNILGEEGTQRETGSDYRWYIDPLDGTTNFAHGFPVFCVSIGLEKNGERIAGAVYDPTRDEMFTAEKGSGASLNGRPIHVTRQSELLEALVATGFPSAKRHKNPNIHFYHQITLKSHGVRRAGAAAIDLAYTACGRVDAYWELNLNPWDTAAGVLLVEEAGGTVTDFSGGKFDIASKEVLASNTALHPAMVEQIQIVLNNGDVEPLPSVEEFARTRNI